MSDQQTMFEADRQAFISALTGKSVEAPRSFGEDVPGTKAREAASLGAPSGDRPVRSSLAASTHPSGGALKERGQALVDRAVDDEWKRHCDQVIERFAKTGDVFTCEDVCEVVGRPDRANAVGARISAWAKRKGGIVCTGFVLAKRPEAHSRAIRTWKGV